MLTTHQLPIPGGTIHYEVRGNGPLMILTGSPVDARVFAGLADELAREHTVVTHDPRGINRSRLDDPDGPSTPQLRADDLAALLDTLGADDADVMGSSGGAVTGLDLATRYPDRVRTLVAHEPPVLTLLQDSAEQLAAVDALVATFHREGFEAAIMAFLGNAGWDEDEEEPREPPSAQDMADGARFFAQDLHPTSSYVPDIAALTAGATRVVVGVGADSGDLLTHRTSTALAERLGTRLTAFPGAHHGFASHPQEFAAALRDVLTTARA
ncbi:alpha/beta fold hydrolase [Actinotalea sp. JY-7876]|uniref:alpha/beta fold hydrolase n=1 Tax=Actinotalea sp. JY-7876 TaxID=2758442 RepID=UPI0015F4BF04|nr:alpha/beta hydrolase [Actinotalea sp. JY-7876]